jgi:hypothetical protein
MGAITSGIVAGVVCAVMAFLLQAARQGQPVTDSSTGFQVFRHHIFVRGLGVFTAFVVPIAITILVIAKPPQNDREYIAVFFLYGLFAVLSAPLLWESTRFALTITPEGLDCRSPWRRRQFFAWKEVEEISFTAFGGWFVIHAAGGRKFRVQAIVPGLGAFLEACEQRLPPEAFRRAKAGYAQLQRPLPASKESP